jgi:glutamate---cysteine ligase / carboxylate-amine ligase
MEFDPGFARSNGPRLYLPRVLNFHSPFEAVPSPDFSVGIEEEYFLVDAQTMSVAPQTPDSLFKTSYADLRDRIGREMLQAQVEVSTAPSSCMADARLELFRLRQTVAASAAEHGLTILAVGTHPTARWRNSVQTPKERYDKVMDGLQMLGQRNLLCGMHVHVEVPDPSRRVEIMSRMIPFLPLLLALSTSSPFWQSRPTGLLCYRLAAYDELPRTGLPELFRTNDEYEAYVAALVRSGAIKDASHIWWAIRPSAKYPTLELRAPDCCTRLADAVAIAALFRTLTRHLFFNPERNAELGVLARSLAVENKWRAQRYGVHGTFVSAGGPVGVGETLDHVIKDTANDAEALGCASEVEHCRTIVANGTSADAQLAIYNGQSLRHGAEAALQAVVKWLAVTTLTF